MLDRKEQGDSVYAPTSVEELQHLVQEVAKAKGCLVIEGAGYHRYGWTDPSCQRLSLAGMKRIIHFDPENLTIKVEAGVTLAELNEHLTGTGLYSPLHGHPQATIGGMIAANANGYMCSAYGTIRDVVLGAEIITPQGECVRTGGQTVKNVAGYDMTKLLIGSHGSLAIIAQVVLRLYPQPHDQGTLLIKGEPLFSLMNRLWQERLPVTALLYTKNAAEKQLAVSFHGSALFVRDMLERSQAVGQEISTSLGQRLEYTLLDQVQEERFFEEVYRTSSETSASALRVRAGIPNDQLTPFLEEADQLAQLLAQQLNQQQSDLQKQAVAEPHIITDATRGIVRLIWKELQTTTFLEKWQELVQRYEGYFFIEHGPQAVKQSFAYQPQSANQAFLQIVKRQFDPDELLPTYW